MPSKSDELAQAAAALQATPSDLGRWLEVAALLAAVGKREAAIDAFVALGKAADAVGQVALAVACARWLAGAKQDESSKALVTAIAATHCKGEARVDWAARPKPPAVPSEAVPVEPVAELSPAAAVAAATAAVSAAAASVAKRVPEQHAPTPLIRVLEPRDFERLVTVMRLTRRKRGDVVVDVGHPAKSLFWIARGAAEVTRGEHHLGELWSGAFFGEIALVGGTTRTAKVTCTEESWILEIPAASVEIAASKAPRLAKVLAEYARTRLLANVMRTSELFSRLSEAERNGLLSRFTPRLVSTGTVLISKGSENTALFVVVSGSCQVRDDGEVIADLTVGDGVGEISLLARKPAIADVVVTEPTVVLCLSREVFDDVAVRHPALLAEVYKLVVDREQANSAALIHDAEELIV
jgi:cAMP-dependent protein kinase regulator